MKGGGWGSRPQRLAEAVQFQPLVVAFGPERLDLRRIDAAGDRDQALEHLLAVGQVPRLVRLPGAAHRLDVEADTAVVAGPLQHPHGVERTPEIDRAERL